MLRLKLPARIVFTAGIMSVVILAFGFRTEATGFTYATGSGFNLRIDSQAFYNGQAVPSSTWSLKNLQPNSDKFFNFNDIKPGDRGTTTLSFHVNKDAWICLDFEKLKEYENGRNEPEMAEDSTGGANSGELADGTEFFAWYDDGGPHPGDGVYQVGERSIFGTSTGKQAATKVFDNKTYALADSVFGTAFTASTTRYVGITWCAGDLAVNVATAAISCDATKLGNEAQTDSFTVDVSIRAEGSKDNKNFKCVKKGTTCEYAGPVKVNITNSATVTNTTTSSSNTGGNSAGAGGTVVTGNATSSSAVKNILNTVNILIGGRSR
ncbi:hypothetical protein JNK62_03570 [bacterium]|nr:hypothetical protein [bacterium]